jgi:hypothetical protein
VSGAVRARSAITAGARAATGLAPFAPSPVMRSPPSIVWSTVNWVDVLEQVDDWLPSEVERVYAILDNFRTHRAPDFLLFALAYPRWECSFHPKNVAYLNLIEP